MLLDFSFPHDVLASEERVHEERLPFSWREKMEKRRRRRRKDQHFLSCLHASETSLLLSWLYLFRGDRKWPVLNEAQEKTKETEKQSIQVVDNTVLLWDVWILDIQPVPHTQERRNDSSFGCMYTSTHMQTHTPIHRHASLIFFIVHLLRSWRDHKFSCLLAPPPGSVIHCGEKRGSKSVGKRRSVCCSLKKEKNKRSSFCFYWRCSILLVSCVAK